MNNFCVITFVGFTNCGKSTLFNYLLKRNLSPVTAKQTTTIENYYYRYENENKKLFLIDTPGFQIKRFHKFSQKGNSNFYISIDQADVICVILNVTKNIFSDNYQKLINSLCTTKENKPIVLLLNKIDLIPKKELIQIVAKIAKIYPTIINIVPISALRGINIDKLIHILLTEYQPSEKGEIISTFLTDNSITTQLLLYLRQAFLIFCNQEIPYSLKFEIIHEIETRNGFVFYIRVLTTRNSQIALLIGRDGIIIKKIIKHCERNCYMYSKARIKLKLSFTKQK